MEKVCPESICTDCSLCEAVCPKQCISMKEGKLGHLFPHIDKEKCIDCGLCARYCPAGTGIESVCPEKAYAAWAGDSEEYKSSTSGGAASVLARHFVREGWVVYGCTSVSDSGDGWKGIRHVRVDKEADIESLKGSKYIQSSLKGGFASLKKDISGGMKVLFIGTPCQVAAVRKFFRATPPGLFTVDIVCHGVPSEALFRKYMKRRLHIDSRAIGSVIFRPGGRFQIEISGRKGDLLYTHKPVSAYRSEDIFYSMFMDGFTYRDSCYKCRFARSSRVSDMTIGDFWGLGKDVPEHPYGVSLVLPVTEKGQYLYGILEDGMVMYERPVREAVTGNEQLRHPKHKSIRIRVFRALAPYLGIGVYRALILDWLVLKRLGKKQ